MDELAKAARTPGIAVQRLQSFRVFKVEAPVAGRLLFLRQSSVGIFLAKVPLGLDFELRPRRLLLHRCGLTVYLSPLGWTEECVRPYTNICDAELDSWE